MPCHKQRVDKGTADLSTSTDLAIRKKTANRCRLSLDSSMAHSQHKISIPLCTYNGERFLPQQLASIVRNKPVGFRTEADRGVDDGSPSSRDQTVRITRDFAASASFPVRISKNDNLGFVANFERAIRLCGGDRITLCDQDDIWYPNRIERTEQEFNAHPEVGFGFFSTASLIDDQDRLQATRLWPSFSFAGKRKGQMFAADYTVLVKNRFVTCATVTFRRRLREICLPVGSGRLHDEWIVATSAAVSEVRPID